jgi:tetratricopeptide (TPR) repeat protein
MVLTQSPALPIATNLAAVVLLLIGNALVSAEDAVYFSHGRVRSQSRLTGEVVDYTGKQLQIRVNGQVATFPAEQVARIEFRRLPEHAEGDQLFAQRDFSEARNRYLKARQGEGRPWVQRMLMAQVAWCYRHLQQYDSAGEVFLGILASDPETPYYDCLPLAWLPQTLTPALEQKSLRWLSSEQPAAALLGASHLLAATSHRTAALEKLRTLRFHNDARIAGLARAQLWRSELATVATRQIDDWQAELQKTPEALRAGPYYLLGQALARNGRAEEAALAFLRVPILYPRERNLAARCLLDAARQLDKTGQRGESARLYREIVSQYAETRDAAEAKSELAKRKE